jgi:hypothetical protein
MNYLNHNATIQCVHGGRVQLFPAPMRSLQIMNSPVVTDMDLTKAMIVGCPQIGTGLKPCTKITSIIAGPANQILVDNERPILMWLTAMTDGNPPGMVTAVNDGGSNATFALPPIPDTPGMAGGSSASAVEAQAESLRNAAQSGAPFCET